MGRLISMVVVAVVLAGCGEWPGFALPEGKKLPAWDVAVSDPRPAVKAGDREEVVLRAPELGALPEECHLTGWDISVSDFLDDALECAPMLELVAPGSGAMGGVVTLDVRVRTYGGLRRLAEDVLRAAGLELRGEGVQWRVGEVGASYDHSRSVLVGDWNVPEEVVTRVAELRGVRCERIGGRDVCTGDPYRIGAFRLALSRLGRAWEQGVRTAVVDAAPERVRALVEALGVSDRLRVLEMSGGRSYVVGASAFVVEDVRRALRESESGCVTRRLRLGAGEVAVAQLAALASLGGEALCSEPVRVGNVVLVRLAPGRPIEGLDLVQALAGGATGYLRIVVVTGRVGLDASIRKILEGPVGGSITVREVWQAYAGGVRQLSRTRADRREGAVTVQDGVVTRSVDVVTSGLSVSVEGDVLDGVWRGEVRISDSVAEGEGTAGVNCSARIEAGEDYAIVCLDLSGNASAELDVGRLDATIGAGSSVYFVGVSYRRQVSILADLF